MDHPWNKSDDKTFLKNLVSGFPKIIDAWKDVKWDSLVLEDRLSLNEVRPTLPVPFKETATESTTHVELLTEALQILVIYVPGGDTRPYKTLFISVNRKSREAKFSMCVKLR